MFFARKKQAAFLRPDLSSFSKGILDEPTKTNALRLLPMPRSRPAEQREANCSKRLFHAEFFSPMHYILENLHTPRTNVRQT